MDDNSPAAPSLTPAAEASRRARMEREAAALRQNLLRRKDHARARTVVPTPPDREDDPQGPAMPCR